MESDLSKTASIGTSGANQRAVSSMTSMSRLFIHNHEVTLGPQKWTMLRRLVVTGGLASVLYEEEAKIVPDTGWTVGCVGCRATLLQAPRIFADDHLVDAPENLKWALGGHKSFATDWVTLTTSRARCRSIRSETTVA